MARKGTIEEWAPIFTRYFSDQQILNPTYMVSTFSSGTWCKLCDGLVDGPVDAHIRKHERELRAWRKKRAAESEAKRKANAAAKRAEKKRARELGIE